MKKLFLLLMLNLLVLSACSTTEEAITLSGMVNTDYELFHDFNEIDIEGGLINHSFEFTNDSEDELTVMNLSTSCGCTKAEVLLSDGRVSPVFGMRDTTEWNEVVAPGDSFSVLVTYDPMAHGPEATGEMNRSVIMTTSSLENGRTAVLDPSTGYSFTQMNIKGHVLSSEDFLNSSSAEDEV